MPVKLNIEETARNVILDMQYKHGWGVEVPVFKGLEQDAFVAGVEAALKRYKERLDDARGRRKKQ